MTLIEAETDGLDELLVHVARWIVLWIVAFYLLCWTYPWWMRDIPASSKEHENDRFWCARSVLGILHALLVSGYAIPALLAFVNAPEYAQFGMSNHLATCRTPVEMLQPWSDASVDIAFAGLVFTTFTLADIVISSAHGLMTWDYLVHHIAFATAGMLLRGHCMLPFNASVLLAMEVSTPFLNYMTFFRNRGDRYKSVVAVTGCAFFATYVFFRVGLNVYGTVVLVFVAHEGSAIPSRVPAWQRYFMLVAIVVGAAVQLFWFPAIAKIFTSKLMQLLSGTEEEASRAIKPGVEISQEGDDHENARSPSKISNYGTINRA